MEGAYQSCKPENDDPNVRSNLYSSINLGSDNGKSTANLPSSSMPQHRTEQHSGIGPGKSARTVLLQSYRSTRTVGSGRCWAHSRQPLSDSRKQKPTPLEPWLNGRIARFQARLERTGLARQVRDACTAIKMQLRLPAPAQDPERTATGYPSYPTRLGAVHPGSPYRTAPYILPVS
jgi:hypothetical protein